MKLGVLQFFSWPERRFALSSVYDRALQRIEIMDRTGYDAVWLADTTSALQRLPVGAHGRDARRRPHEAAGIGTGVSLAPFYHPLRLAEEVALLDSSPAGGLIGAPGAALRGSSSRISGCRPRRAPRAFTRRSRSYCGPGPRSG